MTETGSAAPVTCDVVTEYDWELPGWLPGTATGDIDGVVITLSASGTLHGEAYHFVETWEIRDEQDNLLVAGEHRGVTSPNFWVGNATGDHFTAQGRVTDAWGEWSHLIGRPMTMNGWIGYGPPTIATGVWRIL